ncbi:ABC transporter ATP-binding protein [Wenzhouxiangella sp. XN79A]|uniref:ABC transporter ATP-binding protein n=1 Tax=Wenzhouxiangella sp. XN79A TaxID=2724193 RepID=UPI00144AEEC9|nr:ABC transporter ATP-binding protein [Wenzhouxiangella sp. XN79A]NKI34918.1 ABC transporter ATP-binding protein [Wenzhouxiangella sp. XN79A]
MSDSTIIAMKSVHRIYRTDTLETHALAGVDLEIRAGDYVSIEGPSGCGKSTLLSVIGLLEDFDLGEYRLAGVPVGEIDLRERARLRNREIGFVFQSFNLIQEMTVLENVALPLHYRGGFSRKQQLDKAASLLDQVGLQERADHRPNQLSGGQQQRAAIARALIGDPSLILADEPTGNLDQENSDRIMDLLDSLVDNGVTLLTVTHNPDYARRAHRRVQMLDGRLLGDR